MPTDSVASNVLRLLYEVLFQTLLDAGLYYLGRAFVFFFSLGRWSCEPFIPRKNRVRQEGGSSPWFFRRDGEDMVLSARATTLVGILPLGLLFLILRYTLS